MRIALFVCLALLAACASPREQCLRSAYAEVARLDRLIAGTEANLARGYALAREPVVETGLEFCVTTGGYDDGVDVGLRYCPNVETRYRDRPVAIDPETERRKLAALRARRGEAAALAAERSAACPPP